MVCFHTETGEENVTPKPYPRICVVFNPFVFSSGIWWESFFSSDANTYFIGKNFVSRLKNYTCTEGRFRFQEDTVSNSHMACALTAGYGKGFSNIENLLWPNISD